MSLSISTVLSQLQQELSGMSAPTVELGHKVSLKTQLKASKQIVGAGFLKEINMVKHLVGQNVVGWPDDWVAAAEMYALSVVFASVLKNKTRAKMALPWIVGVDIVLPLGE